MQRPHRCLYPQRLVPAGALMVISHKGKIAYATNALGTMLGIPTKQLMAMDLQAILPAPYSQLHGSFLKVGGGVPQSVVFPVIALPLLISYL